MQTKVLDTVVNLKHQSNIKTKKSCQQNTATKQPTVSFQYEERESKECQHLNTSSSTSGSPAAQMKNKSYKEVKQQNKQQQSISQEQKLQQHQKRRIKKDTVHRKP